MINARRIAKKKTVNWSHLRHVLVMTWVMTALPGIAALAMLSEFGNDSTKKYIPYHDTRDTLPYSGMGVSIVTLWFVLWAIAYCCLKKAEEDEDEDVFVEQTGLRTFFGTGAITAAVGTCWWVWNKAPLDSPIPDLPKLVFFTLAASAVATLGFLAVFGCLARICCRSACYQAFCLEQQSELQEVFVEPPAAGEDEPERVKENEEPEGSPRKERRYYQQEASRNRR